MKQKLDCIMLIDDSEALNYINNRVITKLNIAKNNLVFQSGMKAIEYLQNTTAEENLCPDLILLDINMPGMTGWEFLEQYEKLNVLHQSCTILLMVSTSLNPEDKAKAEQLKYVNGFINKPFQEEEFPEIIGKYC